MILSLFALCAEMTPAIKESQVAIENAFKQILDEKYDFRNFSSEQKFLDALSSAISTDSIIVVGAEPMYYKAFKNFVCNTFDFKCKPTKTVTNLIEFLHPEFSDADIEDHANLPVSSFPLPTQDGVYSGFGLKIKKQLLILVPLDDKRIDYLINNSLFQFVRENMDMSALTADPLRGMTEENSQLFTRDEKKSGELFDALLIMNVVNVLKERGLSISLAETKTVDFIRNISTTSVDLSEVVFLTDFSLEKGELTSRDYAIALAKGALGTSNNALGAAITKVFSAKDETTGEQQYFMYVCVADSEKANVAKLTAEESETPPELIYRAVDELFRIVGSWVQAGYSVVQSSGAAEMRENARKVAKEKLLFRMKIAVSGLIAASSIVSVIVSLVV